MARNILEVWGGDRSILAREARSHALQFSWDRSMEELFGRVYPAALAGRERAAVTAPAAAVLAA